LGTPQFRDHIARHAQPRSAWCVHPQQVRRDLDIMAVAVPHPRPQAEATDDRDRRVAIRSVEATI